MATQIQSLSLPQPLWRRTLRPLALLGVLLLVWLAASRLPALTDQFPATWNLGLRAQINAFQDWVINNRATHPLFVYVFEPLSRAIDTSIRATEDVLLGMSWIVVITTFGLVGNLLGRGRLALLCVVGLLLMGLFGLWEQSMQTLALMGVSVLLALLLGIPLGILAALSDRFERGLRPVLDAMQTMPAFVYLIPVVLLFGVARVPAAIATLIYALPPAIRLTNLGIRQVQPSAIEASRAFGATRWQLLRQVQLPLALPAIMTGVNQTIMMGLSIVVIAALVGAGGLGREVLIALQRLELGQALEAGLAIVALAIILDRLSEALSRIDLAAPPVQRAAPRWVPEQAWAVLQRLAQLPARAISKLFRTPETRASVARRSGLINVVLVVALLYLVDTYLFYFGAFPDGWRLSIREPADATIAWMRDNLYQIGSLPIGTGPFSDFLTLGLLDPIRALLRDILPWPVVVLGVAALAYRVSGWRLALASGLGMLLIGLLGMWVQAMDTCSQVLVTMLVTVAVAVPLGVLVSQSRGAQLIMRPILDFLQTVPTFVYLVPVIMLFNIGRVPGLIAAALYAIPPGIKLTELGIRQIAPESIEAARAFGSTRWQTIAKVQLPLALPAIMLGINQMIMMVLAMVIIAGLVGGAGLGLEVVAGLSRSDPGRGLEAGLAIVILAIILDRMTQAWALRQSDAEHSVHR